MVLMLVTPEKNRVGMVVKLLPSSSTVSKFVQDERLLGNVLLSSAFALFAEGVFQFQRRRPPRWLLWSPVFLVAILFSALLPWYLARVVVGALIFVFQSLVVVVAVL